ncbi:hypothetical protein [Pseudomonas chlororaphis]|uniref:hypothetical protein n=1 Tax=Pseudomonas chlororaphis TaxID=587753 RepID=UPI0019274F80|nr:hypothetical protein [Pseudomonas chlororaphis]QQX60921.1 hypothetical protein JHW28_10355 [Pseudomonas chlororaphis subsp. aurantiaca]
MKLDRALQKRILEAAAMAYPFPAPHGLYFELGATEAKEKLDANLCYLAEHGLIKKCIELTGDGFALPNSNGIQCTKTGMDFLENDGGLSAILGTVTIKIHEDTLRDLLERKILESDTEPAEKSRLVQGVKGLSGEAIKHLTLKLLDQGLEHLPGAVALIGTYLR